MGACFRVRRLLILPSIGLLFGSAAWAAEASVRYQAPSDCPTEADFVRAVAVRGGQLEKAERGERRLAIAVAKDANGYVGTLRLERRQHASNQRTVHASTCADVVDGLAVATALALQTSARSPAAPPASPEVLPAAAVSAPLLSSDSSPSPVLSGTGDRVQRDHQPPDPFRVAPAFTLTAFAGPSVGLVPSTLMPRYELSLTWASLARQGESGRIIGPLMRVGLNLYGGVSYDMQSSSTKLGAQALTAGPCYAPVYDDRGLVLLTCLDLTAGLMGAATVDRNTNLSHAETFGFGSVGAGLEAAYNLGRHFHLALRAGANVLVAPLVYRGADGSELFRSSRYNGYLALGAGGHF